VPIQKQKHGTIKKSGTLSMPAALQALASGTQTSRRDMVECRYSTREVHTNLPMLPALPSSKAQPELATGPLIGNRNIQANEIPNILHNPSATEVESCGSELMVEIMHP
jgi:hypothetical protein